MNPETLRSLPTRMIRDDGAMLKWETPFERFWLCSDGTVSVDRWAASGWFKFQGDFNASR